MDLIIVRHGQTDWNVLKKIQGRTDTKLNEIGIKQALEMSEKLSNEKIDLIICSPLKRAKKTADIINNGRNIPIIFDDRIIERDFGTLEGEISSNFDFDEIWNLKKVSKYYNIEDIKDIFKRVYDFINYIKDNYRDKKILIVTHLGVSIPIRCYFEGIVDENNLLSMCLDNCGIVRYNNIM